MGTFTIKGRAAEAGIDNVDAALRDIMRKAAERSPYDVEVFSGKRGGGGKSRHDTGKAVDVVLRDPRTGQAIANLGSKPGFDAYQGFANVARDIQQQDYPKLSNQFRWGGYFSPSGLNPKGFDLMHFDLKPGASMAFGTWENGLNAEGQAAFAKLGSGMIYSADGRVVAPNGVQYANLWSDPTYAASQARVPPGSIPTATFADASAAVLRRKKNPPVDERVKFLQQTLNDQFGFNLKVDGKFGEQTEIALKAFQKTMGLTDAKGRPQYDGVAGTKTWAALKPFAGVSPNYRSAQEVGLPSPTFRSAQEVGMESQAVKSLPVAATGNTIPSRPRPVAATGVTVSSPPQRPSPLDALTDVVTRPPPQRPSPRSLDQTRLNANLGRELDAFSGISTRPSIGPTPDQRAAAEQELRDNLKRPIDYVRPRPNPLGTRSATPAEAARFDPGNREFESKAPLGDLPGVDSLRTGAAASARPVTESPLESFTRGWNNYAPAEKRPSPFDALTSVSTRPTQRAITAPLPRPRPTVAARPPAPPEERPTPTGFLGTGAPSFRAAQEVGMGPATVAAPLPRPSPIPPGQTAAASARRVVTTRPSPSRGTPARSTAPSRPAARVSANTQSRRKSSLSRAGSD